MAKSIDPLAATAPALERIAPAEAGFAPDLQAWIPPTRVLREVVLASIV